jgi:AraC-like DNA-binding protein
MPDRRNFYKHSHNMYELLLFLDGDADFVVESNTFKLQPFDLLLIKPAQYHFLKINSEKRYDRFIINFAESIVPNQLLPALQTSGGLFRLSKDSGLIAAFYKLDGFCKTFSDDDKRLMLKTTLSEILMLLKYLNYVPNGGTAAINPAADRIIDYINGNITEPLDMAAIARGLFISESCLSHVFTKFFHIGVMQYVRQKKILYAQNLIKSGLNPTKAYLACGFTNYATFYRAYKNVLKLKPEDDK